MEKTTLTQCGGNTVDIDDLVFLGRFKSSKGVTLAIVDADIDVQNCAKLLDCATVFVSVPKVVSQVRCQSNFLPLSVRPSPIFVKNVISFAIITGFLDKLSEVDLELIALTYMLDSIMYKSKHLRNSPTAIHSEYNMAKERLPGDKWMLSSLSNSRIACISTNFAVQHMILQMGLRLLTILPITKIYSMRRWVLRCHFCATMSTEMGRENCPDCGNRVALCKEDITVIQNSVDDNVLKSNDEIQTWCYLPRDILELIFNKLYFTSRIRFRGVCKDWCLPIGMRIDNELPWLLCNKKSHLDGPKHEMLLLDPVHKRAHKTFDSDSRNSVLIGNSDICGSKGGWLIFRVAETGTSILLFLYSPFTCKLIMLPTLDLGPTNLYFRYDKVTFSSTDPTSSECVFVVSHVGHMRLLGISTFRNGDTFWRTNLFSKNNGFSCHNTMRLLCTSKEICYIVFGDGKLGSFCLENEQWSWLIKSHCWGKLGFVFLHLLEFGGGLLTVKHYDDFGICEVLRYDEDEKCWIEQKSLGNKVLFIDLFGYCVRSTFGDTADLADTILRISPHKSFVEVTVYSLKDQKISKKLEAYDLMETIDVSRRTWIEPPYN